MNTLRGIALILLLAFVNSKTVADESDATAAEDSTSAEEGPPVERANEEPDSDVQVESWGVTATAQLEDGSYHYNESGQLIMESQFPSEWPLIDPETGIFFIGTYGMTKDEVSTAATEAGATLDRISEDEWQIGDYVLIFEDDELRRLRMVER